MFPKQFVAEHNSNSVIKVQFLCIKQKAKSLNHFCIQFQYQFYKDEISRRQGLRTTPSIENIDNEEEK